MVEEKHLNIRMRNLKLSIMKTGLGKLVWQHWKQNQTAEFVEWFEAEIYGGTPDNIEYDAERSKTFNLRRE